MFRIQKVLLVLVAVGTLHAQTTQLDLRYQSRDVDFSTANATKPFKSGTTFPSVCAVGEMFFKTDGPAGANLYGCTALNSWTLESTSSGGTGASMASQLGDLAVTRTSSTVLTIGTNCSPTTPCNVRYGSLVYSFVASATATITAGTGTAYVYISSAGALTVGHNLTLNCSSCTAAGSVTSFPADSMPLWTWTATSATWDTSGGVDQRAMLSRTRISPGFGVNIVEAGGIYTPSLDTAAGNTYWAQLAASNTFTSGAKQVFQPGATTAGMRIVPGALPSVPAAGDLAVSGAGVLDIYDGANNNYFPFIPGSGTTPPTAPTANKIVQWGTNFALQSNSFPLVAYLPAANCVNAVARSTWSTAATPAAACRAGTNNKEGLLSPWGATDTAQFSIHLPRDWDSSANPSVSLDLTSTDATNGHTIILQLATACEKGDGSTTDDVAFNAAQPFATVILNGNANRTWNTILSNITMTGCTAPGVLRMQLSRTTDTATNAGVIGLEITIPRLPVVQAN
jgi:hypothetical protein